MVRTIAELVRVRWVAGEDVVEADLMLSLGRYEADLLKRRPDLRGWERSESSLPLDLVLWVPAGATAYGRCDEAFQLRGGGRKGGNPRDG